MGMQVAVLISLENSPTLLNKQKNPPNYIEHKALFFRSSTEKKLQQMCIKKQNF